MREMTTHERFTRMFEHREADRVPIIDNPWNGTILRWNREGMPAGADWRDYFGGDKVQSIGVDITPRFECRTLEETDEYRIYTSPWGVTMKSFKQADSTPEFIDFTVVNPSEWEKAKKRMTLTGTGSTGKASRRITGGGKRKGSGFRRASGSDST
jgi:uroporphyrinogen decarboxylase